MLMPQIVRREWDPFTEMQRLQNEMNRLFDGAGTHARERAYPPVNLWLSDDSVVVTAELPGLTPDDIELTIQEDTLAIQGERRPEADAEAVNWYRQERPVGSFSRTIELPFRVDSDQVQARFDNGVLEVEMRRPEADRPRKIAINGRG